MRPRSRDSMLWYLVAILFGMGGMLFSNQFESAAVRFGIVLLSVAAPLFASGNMLARYGGQTRGKLVLFIGAIMLLLGAAATLSGFSDIIADRQGFSPSVISISRWLGVLSLLLGLFVVLYSVVRTGEAIEEIGDRFQHLAEHISEGFILLSTKGTVVRVNRRFLDMLGLSEDRIVGENAAELVSRLRVDGMASHLDMRSMGLASEYEITWHVQGEERQFWVSGPPLFDRHGGRTGTLATVRDVTEKNRMAKRLERYAKGLQDLVEEQTQKLMQSEERFRDLLLHMNEGFLTIDLSYRIQFANNRICELLRISQQAIQGCEVFDFVDAPGRMKLMDLLKTGGGRPETVFRPELNFVCIDGTLVPVVVAVAPVQDVSGGAMRYSLVITDVGELKRMQNQLEERANELERVNEELRAYGRAKDSFLSNVSHELKTPLSTINGYVEMLDSGSLGVLQAPQLSALKVMGRNVKRLVGLINEMIEFSRMEIRGIRIKSTLFNLGKLIRENVASVQPQALTKDLSISIFVPDGFPPVWADREKVGQVLGILLSNAVKFSQESGMIQVCVAQRAGHLLTIAVSDTGIGIDSAHHQRVFDKFFQVDGSMTRRYEGTGIGLSIAKSIVEAHGGALELESAPNKGATFTIVLPDAVFDTSVQPAWCGGMDRLRVLIAADGQTFRRAVRMVLDGCGCAASEAANGYECVRLAEETMPDVILFNEVLSDIAGPAALASLREHPETHGIPVILLSDEDVSRLQDIMGEARNVFLLRKPFSAQALVARIRQICFRETPLDEGQALEAPPTEPRVLVLDPDEDLHEWLESALRRRHIVYWSAGSAVQAVELVLRRHPDVVFVDIDAQPASTASTLSALLEALAPGHIPLCVLSGHDAANAALPEGVAAVLKKPFSVDEMIQVLDKLRDGSVV